MYGGLVTSSELGKFADARLSWVPDLNEGCKQSTQAQISHLGKRQSQIQPLSYDSKPLLSKQGTSTDAVRLRSHVKDCDPCSII